MGLVFRLGRNVFLPITVRSMPSDLSTTATLNLSNRLEYEWDPQIVKQLIPAHIFYPICPSRPSLSLSAAF